MSEDQRYGLARSVTLPGPLRLDGGAQLGPIDIAYETYGTLNADASNAIADASTRARPNEPYSTRITGPAVFVVVT